MSSISRSTSRGGKGAKQEANTTSKAQKADTKSEAPKTVDHHSKIQPTAEQMRIAQIIDTRTEDPDIKDKIKQVMDATRKTEDEVCTALHDCDNDPDRAVNMLLEGTDQGWETSKKKKNRQPSTAKSESAVNNREAEQEDWGQESGVNPERERSRTRGGGPPRMRGRGWRGRENKENERNMDDFRRGGARMMNGPGRSGRGGRGGGRLGPRTFQSRDKGGFPRSIDTWNNPGAEESSGGDSLKMEKWGDDFPSPEDWDNEEYTGSLADSKVFTPSGGGIEPIPSSEPTPAAEPSSQELTTTMAAQTVSSSVVSQSLETHPPPSQLSPSPVPVVGVTTLSPAQSEYLSQLTQGSESLKSAVGVGTTSSPAASYTTTNSYTATSSAAFQTPSPPSSFTATPASFSSSNYVATSNSYSSQIPEQSLDTITTAASQIPTQTLPPRTKTHRPRVPPPSKIPSSAVEMPGDAISSSIGYLDVQFGGLEFGSDASSFEAVPEQQSKYPSSVSGSVLDSIPSPRPSSNIDLSGATQATTMETYSTSAPQKSSPPSMSSMGQGQKMPSSEAMLATSEHKASQPSFTQPRGTATLEMDKADVGLSYSPPSTVTYQASFQNQKASYAPSSYSSTQVTTTTAVYPSNQYSTNGSAPTYGSQPAAPSSYPSSSYSQQTSVGPSYPAGPTSYPSGASFSNSAPSYQSGAGYGASSLGASAGYAAAGQYQNNYGGGAVTTTQNHAKLSTALNSGTKDSQYDTTTTSSSNMNSTNATTTNPTGIVNSSPALGLNSNSQTVNATSTKVTTSTGKGGVVPNIPPGVPPMMGTPQYIMSQAGLPYFQQPAAVYSYEDIQMLQQRIPHVAAGYYDVGFQAPTSLATGREGGLASVAYSMSDGRFARADNNASPVPSTMSQQNATQAHQQPLLNATALPPGYAYFYGGGMMPGSFQYGTPAIYPMPPATNAHGSTSNTQYPKPGSYGSGYGSGYDGLSQNQDYSKTAYVSGSQSQTKAGVGPTGGSTGSSAADLGATMYGKSHVALGKMNSYEKQFHSGTPPPFNMPGSQSTPMAPSGAYTPHLFIPTIPPHQQHHSTPLMHQPLHQGATTFFR